MEIRIEGFVVGCDEDTDWEEATIIFVPLETQEYKKVHVGIVSAGCKKAFTFDTEELYAALCSAMAMRRQAQATKANEARRWNAWP